MQLQRVLVLAGVALMGCAVTTSVASNVSIAESTAGDEDRIFGGTEADASKYPFTASLRIAAEGRTFCGGTLIAPQYIVTAAHCVKNTTFVSLGSKFMSGNAEGERLLVTDVWVHPKYDKSSHVYDVAVMKLEKPTTIVPLPLCKRDGSQNKERTVAVVRGWGRTEDNAGSNTLREVNVKIISNAVCNKLYNNFITSDMICAGEGGGMDACEGDSGGGLIANSVLVGIVSWGGVNGVNRCGEAPGVYVRVTSVLDFIQEKIGSAGSPTTTPSVSTAPTAAPSVPTEGTASTTAAPPATLASRSRNAASDATLTTKKSKKDCSVRL